MHFHINEFVHVCIKHSQSMKGIQQVLAWRFIAHYWLSEEDKLEREKTKNLVFMCFVFAKLT